MKESINIKEKNDNLKKIITENMIYLRKQKNLSGLNIADVLGVSRQAYYNYESGQREMSLSNLKILADYYGVTLDLIASTSLSDSRPPILTFPTLKKLDNNYKFTEDLAKVTSFSNDLLVVKESETLIKIFEANTTYIEGQELLFEFNNKLYTAVINFTPDGDGFFIYEEKAIKITKRDAKSLVYLGILFATIDKRYEKDYFF
ncbi:MAG TPA: helix-turn-helix transcriptional regulator [Bacilli bacterium]|nr:helix-turn-helix transcriptional regulator [Bacilli bacterium]